MQPDGNELDPLDPAVERLLQELARRRVGLVVDGGRLRYSPLSAVTPELLVGLRTHKAEVMAIVREGMKQTRSLGR